MCVPPPFPAIAIFYPFASSSSCAQALKPRAPCVCRYVFGTERTLSRDRGLTLSRSLSISAELWLIMSLPLLHLSLALSHRVSAFVSSSVCLCRTSCFFVFVSQQVRVPRRFESMGAFESKPKRENASVDVPRSRESKPNLESLRGLFLVFTFFPCLEMVFSSIPTL